MPGIAEHISVLYEYSRADQRIDFFMEPGEKYGLGHLFLLPPGHYAAKLVFIGERATAAEYWSRMFYFYVPIRETGQVTDVVSGDARKEQQIRFSRCPEAENLSSITPIYCRSFSDTLMTTPNSAQILEPDN
jgi:hypothetical protein